ncbi:putative wd domain-containing protein [Botrytis cinerea BcDW1]|uniref:Putative wd domain-containing protein n=1 Tax=Botryotinia fuckeliana (strain BcDW1) TaxID=1290391 RepID=M7TTR4_BOTF1|nr:putative wd domain-containing protein [Botrytis cinerea BcDW1]
MSYVIADTVSDHDPFLQQYRDENGKERKTSLSMRIKNVINGNAIGHNLSTIAPNSLRLDGPSDSPKTPNELSSSTLPRPSTKSRPTLSNALRARTSVDSTPTRKSASSLHSPDRFLPVLKRSDSAAQSFRANKDPGSLSPYERLMRHSSASLDAFNPRRRATSPIPLASRPDSRRIVSANRGRGATALIFQRSAPTIPNGERQVSVGTVWAVGGVAPVSAGISDGRGGMLGSGTNAPLYTTSFSASRPKAQEDFEKHEDRLAQALDIDRTQRVFEFRDPLATPPATPFDSRFKRHIFDTKTTWNGTEWVLGGPEQSSAAIATGTSQSSCRTFQISFTFTVVEFFLIFSTVLDAPNLRDDFYCSVLAYSGTSHTLAVGLGSLLYAWSEMAGVHLLHGGSSNASWLTSLAFSSTQGAKSILAFGRSDGSLSLLSLYDSLLPRFEVQQPCPIACVTWRPSITMRPSRNPLASGIMVKTEDLIVGDEQGNIYYYAVEWPDAWEITRDGWSGSMALIAKISIHTQQICGLSFSTDGSSFATGGNDNLCCLFRTNEVTRPSRGQLGTAEEVFLATAGMRRIHSVASQSRVKEIISGAEKHRWIHGAAVKAIAFCPWRDGLIATGGGSNDKCIHFFHTSSGACLATISVAAQVTSLIWSTTRREIAATFGYAQPEHPYRIAVFSWPDCKQVAAIPWEGEHRALFAIPYPGGPNESHSSREGGRALTRTAQEGCLVVASSDESVKFHEVWTSSMKATSGGEGLLGGSDILEGLEGIDKEGAVIR